MYLHNIKHAFTNCAINSLFNELRSNKIIYFSKYFKYILSALTSAKIYQFLIFCEDLIY